MTGDSASRNPLFCAMRAAGAPPGGAGRAGAFRLHLMPRDGLPVVPGLRPASGCGKWGWSGSVGRVGFARRARRFVSARASRGMSAVPHALGVRRGVADALAVLQSVELRQTSRGSWQDSMLCAHTSSNPASGAHPDAVPRSPSVQSQKKGRPRQAGRPWRFRWPRWFCCLGLPVRLSCYLL